MQVKIGDVVNAVPGINDLLTSLKNDSIKITPRLSFAINSFVDEISSVVDRYNASISQYNSKELTDEEKEIIAQLRSEDIDLNITKIKMSDLERNDIKLSTNAWNELKIFIDGDL